MSCQLFSHNFPNSMKLLINKKTEKNRNDWCCQLSITKYVIQCYMNSFWCLLRVTVISCTLLNSMLDVWSSYESRSRNNFIKPANVAIGLFPFCFRVQWQLCLQLSFLNFLGCILFIMTFSIYTETFIQTLPMIRYLIKLSITIIYVPEIIVQLFYFVWVLCARCLTLGLYNLTCNMFI